VLGREGRETVHVEVDESGSVRLDCGCFALSILEGLSCLYPVLENNHSVMDNDQPVQVSNVRFCDRVNNT
jgi:hypothetical protein